nr:hypothetical protein B0A51_10004 [Rachicladosporium sp. CCFEE 5018]
MSRKERRAAKKAARAKKASGADGDLNDSRTANTGRKRKRNDNAIDVARQDAKRAKLEEEDSDYVPFQQSSGITADHSDYDSSSVESGEISSSESPGQLNVVTRQRSKSNPSVPKPLDIWTLQPESLRSRALRHREKHPEWSSVQILKRIGKGAADEQIRDAARDALASWSKLSSEEATDSGLRLGDEAGHHEAAKSAGPLQRPNLERGKVDEPLDYIPLPNPDDEAGGYRSNGATGFGSGEVDSTTSHERLPSATRQQRGTAAAESNSTRLRQDVSPQHKLSTLRPKLLRIHATETQKSHSDWSLLQVLEHVEANAPNEKVRFAANRVTAKLAPMVTSRASRPAFIAVEPHRRASDLRLDDSVPLSRPNSRASEAINPDDQKRSIAQSTARLPQEMMHADAPAPIDLTFEHMNLKSLVQAVQVMLAEQPTWSVQLILKFLEITSSSPKLRNSAADTLQTWYEINSILVETRSTLVSMLCDRVKFRTPAARSVHEERSAVFQATRVNLDNVEPPPLQAALRLHMRTSETGLTPEAAMRKVLLEGNKAFKRFATQSLMKQHQKCVLKLNRRYHIDLAQLFTSTESVRADLDVVLLCAVTDKSDDVHEKDFGRLLRKRCTEQPALLAAGHLYNLMCRRPDANYHILACEAMSRYLLTNAIKKQAVSGDAAQDQRYPLVGPEDVDGTQREALEPAAGTVTNEEPVPSSISSDDNVECAISAELDTAIGDQFLQLGDLSPEDQASQYRYFGLSDLGDSPYCLCCGEQGHHESTCPDAVCQHCHSTTHFSRRCPTHQKCERCRQRGHSSLSCSNHSKVAGAPGDECDVCSERGHAEEQCAKLWTTFEIDAETFVPVSRGSIVVSCYNCGKANDHWGDDCKTLPDYVIKDIMHDTWSAVNAERYIFAAEKTVRRNREHDEEESMHGRDGGIQAHQLAQLGDWL